MVELYSYYRSSAAYRVRIALHLKQIPYAYKPVHLVRNGGEQHSENYVRLNPLKLVPSLVDGESVVTQSLAIIEYLDEVYPHHPLLPAQAPDRARARELAQLVACDIHPLNNLRVLQYLSNQLQVDPEQSSQWYAHWIKVGFEAFEQILRQNPNDFCVSDQPTIADCCLIPQVYNAKRFKVDLSPYEHIVRIYERCLSMAAFVQASPEQQPDIA